VGGWGQDLSLLIREARGQSLGIICGVRFPGFHPGLLTIALPGLRTPHLSAPEGRQLLAQGETLGINDQLYLKPWKGDRYYRR
jgi:hypothetical protein